MTRIVTADLDEGPEGAALEGLPNNLNAAAADAQYAAQSARTGPFGAFSPASVNGTFGRSGENLPGVSKGTSVKWDVIPRTNRYYVSRVGDFGVLLNPDGKWEIRGPDSNVVFVEATVTAVADVWYEIRWQIEKGTTTGDGECHLRIYRNGEPTPYVTFDSTTANTGIANYTSIVWGKYDIASVYTMHTDECYADDDPTVWIARTGELPEPTLTVTPTNPTGAGLSDGTADSTWTASTGAAAYESCILAGSVTTGAVSTRSDATLARTFTDLAAGTYTVAVRAV